MAEGKASVPVAEIKFTVDGALRFEYTNEGTVIFSEGADRASQVAANSLRAELARRLEEVLPPEYSLRELHLETGSLEIFVALGAVYSALRSAKQVIETIEWFYERARLVVSRVLADSYGFQINDVTGEITVVPEFMLAAATAQHSPQAAASPTMSGLGSVTRSESIVFAYIAVLNIALLIAVVILAFR